MANQEDIIEIKLQLGRIVSHIDSESRNRERTKEALDKLTVCLFGDGDKSMGLISKVNQLLEEHHDRKRMQTAILVVVTGLVVTKFWELFIRHA